MDLKKISSLKPLTNGQDSPLIPTVGLLALVPDRWGMKWMGRHQILIRLARYFHVVWVNPAHEWRRTLEERPPLSGIPSFSSFLPGFIVYTPESWLPKFYRPPWLAEFFSRQRLRRAYQALIRRGCQKIVLCLWRPDFKAALLSVPHDLSCYFIADEYSFSEAEHSLDKQEAQLIATVDQVFVSSRGLFEKKGAINPHSVFMPNGVDYKAYAQAAEEPPDLASIPRPRVGYAGYIKKQLDWPLMHHLTRQHQEWSFVFVGEQKSDPEVMEAVNMLSRQRNVHFLGAKMAQDLIAYPKHFDVCMMPYQVNAYTQCIYPLKLHEYLASGRPTVGPRIRSLEEFINVVALPETPQEWTTMITHALSPTADTPELRAARQAIAQQYDWQVLVARIANILLQRLGHEYANHCVAFEQDRVAAERFY